MEKCKPLQLESAELSHFSLLCQVSGILLGSFSGEDVIVEDFCVLNVSFLIFLLIKTVFSALLRTDSPDEVRVLRDDESPRENGGRMVSLALVRRTLLIGSETFRNFSVRNFLCSDLQRARNFMQFGLEHHRDHISR